MFTGIIKALGTVSSLEEADKGLLVGIELPKEWKSQKGDSIAVNGTCLTVVKKKKSQAFFFCQKETLDLTNIPHWKKGEKVNVEPAMKMSDELGGHIVQGHVDCKGKCHKKEVIGEGWRYWVSLPSTKPKGIVLKGSIALDGISLTVSRLKKNMLSVDIIPYTYENTNIQFWEKGTVINLETDIIGKYVESYLSALKKPKKWK